MTKRSSNFFFIAFVGLMAAAQLQRAWTDEPAGLVERAEAKAKAWFIPMDAKEYETSYEQGGSLLHQKVTLDSWMGALTALRANYGVVEDRKLTDHEYLPQGLDGNSGEFMKLVFSTHFSKLKHNFVEYVILHRTGSDWEIAGYAVTPPAPSPEELAAAPHVFEDSSVSQTEMMGDHPKDPSKGKAEALLPLPK